MSVENSGEPEVRGYISAHRRVHLAYEGPCTYWKVHGTLGIGESAHALGSNLMESQRHNGRQIGIKRLLYGNFLLLN
jgi:hypothetical protein